MVASYDRCAGVRRHVPTRVDFLFLAEFSLLIGAGCAEVSEVALKIFT
jgi:hypothetical protein